MTYEDARAARSPADLVRLGLVFILAAGGVATMAFVLADPLPATLLPFAVATFATTLGAAGFRILGGRDAAWIAGTLKALQSANLQQQLILASTSNGYAMFDPSTRLVAWNERFVSILGLPPDQINLGMTLLDLILRTDRAQGGRLEDAELYAAERKALMAAGSVLREVVPSWNDRTLFVKGQPVAGGGWVVTLYDSTDEQLTPSELRLFDAFEESTNLPNRDHLLRRLQTAFTRRSADLDDADWPALLQIDIARMKSFHSSMGPETVDRLMNEIKMRLMVCLGAEDILARVRVDEFAVMPARIGTSAQAVTLAERLLTQVNGRYEVDGHSISIVASIGIALAPQHGTEGAQLLQRATIAMEAAAGGAWQMFEPAMEGALAARLVLESDMAQALELRQFQLVYQPQVNLRYNRIAGFEALLRWHHPERGVVSPLDFIPLAEASGLIVPLGAWVIRRACHDALAWPCDIRVAVNLSVIQLHDAALVDAVQQALASSGLAPQRLELEVTETVLLSGDNQAMTMLHRLRALGVRIAMDDFGTGHSSLSDLRDFPFDKIKIDKSFVQQMLDRPDCLAIVRSVTGLAGSLGMAVTAEGAETAEQVERLRLEGCTEVQGFYFSRPRPLEELQMLLERDFSLA